MKTVVLLSGGIDSAVAVALHADDAIEALTIDYGQRHCREIHSAWKIATHYNIPWRLITLDPTLFDGSTSALLGQSEIPAGHAEQPDNTYVPARNTVLLALAAARAESIGAQRVVIGANADDAAGYPDCRPDYIESFRDVLQTGTVGHIWVAAPLLTFTKERVRAMADELDVPLHLTWSCYEGGGEPCGRCGACQVTS